jgi:transglutaminase/protease-like cytokinesis protein 3
MQNKLVVKEENDFKQFWNKILFQIYQKNTRQNQFIQEVIKLKTIFPDNIKQFNVYYNNVIVAEQLFLKLPESHIVNIFLNLRRSKTLIV